ncbi:MerR family transcriptional regulator [Methylobacterium oxalidis]|uniref:MerR family transcriptional regulator n=1 Tax=Methylobacterium oxalidis TaxID=944322 RepID=UPI003315BB12
MGVTIWELSERTGVNASTIRYYERRAVLPVPHRLSDGQNVYAAADIARVRFVRFGRGLRLELDEIRALIEMIGEGNSEEIDVFEQTIRERATQLQRFCEAMRSVSDAIRAGEIEEAGAFDRLTDEAEGQPAAEAVEESDGEATLLSTPNPKRKRAKS